MIRGRKVAAVAGWATLALLGLLAAGGAASRPRGILLGAPSLMALAAVAAGIAALSWSCAASGGAVCPNASGSGALNETIATFPGGAQLIYTLTATVSATPPPSSTNTASLSPPAGAVCEPDDTAPPCTAAVTLTAPAQLALSKTDGQTSYAPGSSGSYTITITNESQETVQLLSRHWIITNATGQVEEVRGPGVVGEQPVLEPNESFTYTSGCPLTTSFGTMEGTYQMVTQSGERFDARIAPFTLSEPYTVH